MLACVLAGTLAWQGYEKYFGAGDKAQSGEAALGGRPYAAEAPSDPAARGWERDFDGALAEAATAGKSGDVTSAEMEIDRAASIVGSAWQRGLFAEPDFFTGALAALDGVVATHPENERLADHAFQAKIALAELRWGGAASAAGGGSEGLIFAAPRAIAAHTLVNAASIGATAIDATKMPESAEVFLPPSMRALEDGVRVSGLRIEGASQTLDGVSWKDVTFVGTRLRYEGGAASLKNVKFVRCTFGFTDDEGGRKLIEALVRGGGTVDVAKSGVVSDGRVVRTE